MCWALLGTPSPERKAQGTIDDYKTDQPSSSLSLAHQKLQHMAENTVYIKQESMSTASSCMYLPITTPHFTTTKHQVQKSPTNRCHDVLEHLRPLSMHLDKSQHISNHLCISSYVFLSGTRTFYTLSGMATHIPKHTQIEVEGQTCKTTSSLPSRLWPWRDHPYNTSCT